MRINLAQLCVGLLALGQLASALVAPSILGHPPPSVSAVPPLADAKNATLPPLGDAEARQHLVARVPAPMVSPAGWGNTWVGTLPEPPNSGWTKATVHEVARDSYHALKAQYPDEVLLVAALWARGRAIYLGTIPHGAGATQFQTDCQAGAAPRLWRQLQGRTLTSSDGTNSRWHAEDMALLEYERHRPAAEANTAYDADRPYMAVYGQRFKEDEVSRKDPCGMPDARITPSCYQVLRRLDVDFL